MIHGFAGYFEAQLFGDVTLSILPATHDQGSMSAMQSGRNQDCLRVGEAKPVGFGRGCQ